MTGDPRATGTPTGRGRRRARRGSESSARGPRTEAHPGPRRARRQPRQTVGEGAPRRAAPPTARPAPGGRTPGRSTTSLAPRLGRVYPSRQAPQSRPEAEVASERTRPRRLHLPPGGPGARSPPTTAGPRRGSPKRTAWTPRSSSLSLSRRTPGGSRERYGPRRPKTTRETGSSRGTRPCTHSPGDCKTQPLPRRRRPADRAPGASRRGLALETRRRRT